jgi:hypothetical protein
LVLRSRLGEYPRTSLVDNGSAELDVVASFAAPDQSTFVTVYIFRPALMSVPVWFDRSETQILLRDEYRGAQPVAEARPFAPPSSAVASALRRSYLTGSESYKTTGLAVMPLGEWLVAIRISSRAADPAALETSLDVVIAALGWPAGVEDGEPAGVVAACAEPLDFARRAKLQRPNLTDALMGAALAGVVADRANDDEQDDAAPAVFCRDTPGKPEYGVYRLASEQNRKSYVMALGDAGRIISVAPSLGAALTGVKGYAVSFGDLDRTLVYPNFDKLASPDRALEAVTGTSPVASTARGEGGGNTITIGVGSE